MNQFFNYIKINDYNIIGSYNDPNRKYTADIDLEEKLNIDRREFLKMLQDKLLKMKTAPDIWFIDFKAGIFGGKSIKWTIDEVIHGFRYIDNDKFDLLGLLYHNTTIKLDVIIYKNKKFVPLSINYYFDNIREKNTANKLLAESNYLLKKGDIYSYCKRRYLYNRLIGNRTEEKKYLNILNSKLGLLGSNLNILEQINLLLKSNNTGYNMDSVINNIVEIQKESPNNLKHIFVPLISGGNKDKLIKNIDMVCGIIEKYLKDNIKI